MSVIVHIVDDDDGVRDSMRELLASFGYTVREYPSAEAFLGSPRGDVACLLVDHHMPGMSGLDLLEHLTAIGDKTPALVITGGIDPAIATRAKLLGVKYLNKPVDENAVVEWIGGAMASFVKRPG